MSKRQTRPNSITAALTTNYPDHSDEEVMQALVTAGALIALADGEIAAIERDALVNYLDRQGFVPTMSSREHRRSLRQLRRTARRPVTARK